MTIIDDRYDLGVNRWGVFGVAAFTMALALGYSGKPRSKLLSGDGLILTCGLKRLTEAGVGRRKLLACMAPNTLTAGGRCRLIDRPPLLITTGLL